MESPVRSPEELARDRMVVFNFLAAAAVVIHVWNRSRGMGITLGAHMEGVTSTVTFLTAIVLMIWPGSVRLLVTLAALQLFHIVIDLPYTADHWVLMGFMDVIILLSAARLGGGKPPRLGELWEDIAPSARLVFVICYLAPPFSKLNAGFFDPEVSCGTLFQSVLGQLVPIPPWEKDVIIGSTLLAEGFIGLGVLFPRTRSNAIRVGLLFHFFVSLLPVIRVFDFSVTVFACLLFFAPDDVTERLRARWTPFVAAFPVFASGRVRRGIAIALGAVIATFVLVLAPGLDAHVALPITFIAFTFFGVFLVYNGLRAIGPTRPDPAGRRYFRLAHPSHAIVLVVVLITVVSPYIGLKTGGVFTMFSNLRTEGGVSNHYLVPRMHIFGYQDDLVEIVSSSDPVLTGVAERKELLPFEALRRQVGEGTDVSVVFIRDGQTIEHGPGKPPAFTPLGGWLDLWLLFRPVPTHGEPLCTN